MCRETAVQTESNKQGLIDSVPVREPSFVVSHPQYGVFTTTNFSKIDAMSRLKGGCGQDWPPHIL